MDFTDEEREVLFKSTMEKLWKAAWELSIGNGNNRSYNGILNISAKYMEMVHLTDATKHWLSFHRG